MDEDQLIEEVLDKFINCHEQTYEEFPSTFPHLSKEDNGTKKGAFGMDSSKNVFTSVKCTHKMGPSDLHLRDKTVFLRTSSQCSEEEQVISIVMGESQKVGGSLQGDLNRAGKVKVDNFLDLEDLDINEDMQPQMSKQSLLLPGEVEEDVSTSTPSYIPSAYRQLAPEEKPRLTTSGVGKPVQELFGDEVQPFSLDEEFDYDSVVLTPKFTSAEMDTLKELSKQRNENPNIDSAEPGV
ncbi:intraflagellar transport-associated protein [Rhynchocyon petersi]